jgi:hypothetical protein
MLHDATYIAHSSNRSLYTFLYTFCHHQYLLNKRQLPYGDGRCGSETRHSTLEALRRLAMHEYHAAIASTAHVVAARPLLCSRHLAPTAPRSLCLPQSARPNCAANSASKSAGRAFSRPIAPQKT